MAFSSAMTSRNVEPGDAAAETFLDLGQLLTPQEVESYRQHMEIRDGDGRIVVTAAEMTKRMLHMLVTEHGHNNKTGGVHIGRKTMLPLLMEALVGSEPDVGAWIEAIAQGKFDVAAHIPVRKPGNKTGSAGNYLPRILTRYERTANKRGSVHATIAQKQRTELGLLIAATLIRELRKAIGAKVALGSAWPLMRAVSQPKDAELRRYLADFGADKAFLGHLRASILNATREWAEHAGRKKPLSTNAQVASSFPAGAEPAVYFATVEDRDKRRENELVAFGKLMLGSSANAHDRHVLDRLANEEPAYADWRAVMTSAILPSAVYLTSDPLPLSSEIAEAHCRRLLYLMPVAAERGSDHQLIATALPAVPFDCDDLDLTATGIGLIDKQRHQLGRAVFRYARDIGPPPPTVPLDHLALFQASACYLSLAPDWTARDKWEAAKFKLRKADSGRFDLLHEMAAAILADPMPGLGSFDPLNHTLY